MSSTTVTEHATLNCSACGGQCCNYFALQIDTPTTAEEFDNLRWYLAHKQVAIFIEGTAWYLQINNPCQNLTPKGACGIYEQRPQICRDYGWDPSGKSECHGTDRPCDHDHFFSTREELEAYLIQKKKRWTSMPRSPKR
jgi:Fe-S-cluster containining protein